MRTIFICTLASLALVAGSASGEPGGKGDDHGKSAPQGQGAKDPGDNAKTRGEGKAPAPAGEKARNVQARSDQGPAEAEREPRRAERPEMRSPVKVARRSDEQKPDISDKPGQGNARAEKKAADRNPGDRADEKRGNTAAVSSRPDIRRPERKDLKWISYKGPGGKDIVVPTNDRVRVLTRHSGFDWAALHRPRAYNGCPPGLAKKYNGCIPPGLDRQPIVSWLQPVWYLRDYDGPYRYRYLDGYMVRLGPGDSVLSYIPLLGGALAIGQIWPSAYEPVMLPDYYDSYYDLGPADSYRYYDDAIYRVDPDTAAIESVVALLTGNDIAIGRPMPVGYEVYNVPYDYRDQYYDGPDAIYRYSDGYVYQIDPTTRLVQAAIELLV